MPFDRLEYIRVIAEEKNMRKAAERLFISQPALTGAVNRLERELQARLLDRSRRPVALTEAGLYYLKEMQHIRQLELNMRARLRSLEEQRDAFTLGIGRGRAMYWMPVILPAFRRLFPHTDFLTQNGDIDMLSDMLLSGRADAVLGTLNILRPELRQMSLLRENLVFAVPGATGVVSGREYEGHSLLNPLPIAPERLNGAPFILTAPGSSYYSYLELERGRHGFSPGETIRYNQPAVAARLAGKGLGVFFASQNLFLWEGLGNSPDMFFCTLSLPLPCQNVRLYYIEGNKEAYVSAMAQIIRRQEELMLKQSAGSRP